MVFYPGGGSCDVAVREAFEEGMVVHGQPWSALTRQRFGSKVDRLAIGHKTSCLLSWLRSQAAPGRRTPNQ